MSVSVSFEIGSVIKQDSYSRFTLNCIFLNIIFYVLLTFKDLKNHLSSGEMYSEDNRALFPTRTDVKRMLAKVSS